MQAPFVIVQGGFQFHWGGDHSNPPPPSGHPPPWKWSVLKVGMFDIEWKLLTQGIRKWPFFQNQTSMVCTVRQNPSKNKLKLECISLLLSLESLYFAYKHNFFVLSGSQFYSVGDHSNPPPGGTQTTVVCTVRQNPSKNLKQKTECISWILTLHPRHAIVSYKWCIMKFCIFHILTQGI